MKYKKSDNQIVLRLEKGEEISQKLLEFLEKENIHSGSFNAIGAVKAAEIGFYNLETKEYSFKKIEAHHEIVSLTGNISLVDEKPFIHMHCVLSNEKFECVGGHLKNAIVGATCEIFLNLFDKRLEREKDEEIGLKLLKLD